jgi:hypothetical protein
VNRDELFKFFIELLKTVRGVDIANATGYSDGAISAVKNGKYNGDDTLVLQAIFAVYGKWHCSALGETVGLAECQKEMAKPWSAGNIKQWALCQKCERRN